MNKAHLFILVFLVQILSVSAQLYDGYVLFSRNNSTTSYLIDENHTVVHTWTAGSGGYSAYLLEDGGLLRTAVYQNGMNGGGTQGRVQKIGWNNTVLWTYNYSSSTYQAHHDIEPMPNGNVLMIAWEKKTAAQATQAGRDDNVAMWPDHIIEVQPTGTNSGQIVWEWHAWDHLIQDYDPTKDNYGVVADHPELLDVNLGTISGGGPGGGGDWMHINGISYNAEYDEIVISSHTLDEFYVIDHSTTTAEAAGHTGGNSGKGGDFLYRWGNPSNYDAPGSTYFDVVHCSAWVPTGYPGAGHILAFNNNETSHQSVVAEINPPRDAEGHYTFTPGTAWAPTTPYWQYSNGTTFYSNHLGSCQRLPNGNTMICEATSGYLFEVNPSGNIVWEYDTTYEIARCMKYGSDYPGLSELFPTGFVSGTIRDGITNLPITGAEITLGQHQTVSSATGEFTIELAAGTYQLSCQHPGYEPYTHATDIVVTTAQTTTVNVLMTPITTGFVSGTIRDDVTSLPIADVAISLGQYQTVSSVTGEFTIELSAGTYQLSCQHPDYELYAHASDIEVSSSQTTTVDVYMTHLPVGVDDEQPGPVLQLRNYPNPFNPETYIQFNLTASANVALDIFNSQGKKVRSLIDGVLPANEHSVLWNGTNDSGDDIASGIYFIRLTTGGRTTIRKIALIK